MRVRDISVAILIYLNLALAEHFQASGGGDIVAAQLQFCGSRLEKPPLEKLLFRASLKNNTSERRWVLLPTVVYASPTRARENAGINRIDLFADQSRKIKLLRFSGTLHVFPYLSNAGGGFQGILLAPKTDVVLPLQIEIWGRRERMLPLKILTANQVTLHGRTLDKFFHLPLASTSSSEITHLSKIDSWESQDSSEVSMHLGKVTDFEIADALANKCDVKVH